MSKINFISLFSGGGGFQIGFEAANLNCILSSDIDEDAEKTHHRNYQKIPFQEAKLVRCVRGKVFEVILDLRKDSKTYKKWISEELSSDNYKLIYVPEGCALGFQTLEDETELFYQMSQYYEPEASLGVKWDDPAFNIKWPLEVTVISEKDSSLDLFSE